MTVLFQSKTICKPGLQDVAGVQVGPKSLLTFSYSSFRGNTAALPFADLKASVDQSKNPPYIFPTDLKFSKNKTQIKTDV